MISKWFAAMIQSQRGLHDLNKEGLDITEDRRSEQGGA
jgi:hypothetical protein